MRFLERSLVAGLKNDVQRDRSQRYRHTTLPATPPSITRFAGLILNERAAIFLTYPGGVTKLMGD
jgi:hypothetical protein